MDQLIRVSPHRPANFNFSYRMQIGTKQKQTTGAAIHVCACSKPNATLYRLAFTLVVPFDFMRLQISDDSRLNRWKEGIVADLSQ